MRHSTNTLRKSRKSSKRPFGLENLETRTLLSVSPGLPMAADGDEPGFFVVDHTELATDPNAGFENQLRIRFSESVDLLPTNAIEVISPTGQTIPATVDSLNATDWSIRFASSQFAGTYQISVSPWGEVADLGQLNQDRDDADGEPSEDVYRFSSKIAAPVAASFPYFEDFEPNGLNSPAAWQFASIQRRGRNSPVEIVTTGNMDPNHETETGNHALRFVLGAVRYSDFLGRLDFDSPISPVDQFAELTIDLSGQESAEHVTLSFLSDFVEVEISDNGEHWFQMYTGTALRDGSLPAIHLDVLSTMRAKGIAFDDAVHFRFSSDNSFPANGLGLLDDIHFHNADRIGPYVQNQQWQTDDNGSYTGVEVAFNEQVDLETIAADQVVFLNPLGQPIELATAIEVVGDHTVSYTFTAPTNIGGEYTLSFPNATDIHGNFINQGQHAFSAIGNSVTQNRPLEGTVTVPHHQDFEDTIGFAGWSFVNTTLEASETGTRLSLGEGRFSPFEGNIKLKLDLTDVDANTLMLGLRGEARRELAIYASNDENSRGSRIASLRHVVGLATIEGTAAIDLGAGLVANGIELNDSVYLQIWRDHSARWNIDDLFVGNFDLSGAQVTNTSLLSNQFSIEFSEAIDPDSFSTADVNITSSDPNNPVIHLDDSPTWTDNGRTVILSISEPLVAGEYRYQIRNQILDLAGNPLNQNMDSFSGQRWHDLVRGTIRVEEFALGDLNTDHNVDHDDVDLMCSAIHTNVTGLAADLNGDAEVGTADLDMLLHDLLDVQNGDLDLSGHIDNNDFQRLRDNLFSTSAMWSDGDLNCDGTVDGSDFNILAANRFATSTLSARNVRIPRAAPTNPTGSSTPADAQAAILPVQVRAYDSIARRNSRSEILSRRIMEPHEKLSATDSVFATLAERPGLSMT